MKEINDILSEYKKIDPATERVALATVVRVEGSSYRRTGARMLIHENGQWTGGISGGCLEGDALRRAKQAIVQNKAAIVTYDTTQDDGHQIGVGLGCNGIIDVLLAPVQSLANHNPLEILRKCVADRREHVVLTLTGIEKETENAPVGSMFYFSNGENGQAEFPFPDLREQVLASVREAFASKQSSPAAFQSEQFGQVGFFIEYLPPPIHLVLCGAQYDVYPMASLAKAIGWKVS
ncbi:MAG: XdhC family protein, partial [Bacteroidota bacterium]